MPIKIYGTILFFMLHMALGMLIREWGKVGFVFTDNFLLLYLLAPSLLIIDGILIYNHTRFNNKGTLIQLFLYLIGIIMGAIIGWPNLKP